MSTRRKTLPALMMLAVSMPAGSEEPVTEPDMPALGRPAPPALVERWNLGVFPDGRGLPEGAGTVAEGKRIYEHHCIACHAEDGAGGSGDRLARAETGLTEEYPQKTIGNFWPYATTLFDFIRRSKPMNRPGSLNNDEVYALTAYLLHLNEIIEEDTIMNRDTLSQVTMPNADGFIDIWAEENP